VSLAHNASPTCRQCSALLQVGAPTCGTCGCRTAAAPAAPYAPVAGQPVVVVAAKSAGIAVLLTLLWLGAGHLYAGKIGAGIALVVFDLVLAMLAATLFGLIIAVPVWMVTFAIAAFLAANAVSEFNRRNGIVVR
jgi:TM2 domain-containing membrane protein YozV